MNKLVALIFLSLVFASCKKDKSLPYLLHFDINHVNNNFLVNDVSGVIGPDTITLILPNDTTSRLLVPNIQVSEGATVSPSSNLKMDFSQPVRYTVKASNGAIKSYVVVCKSAAITASSAQLKNLKINGADCVYVPDSKTFYYPVTLSGSLNNYTVSFDSTYAKVIKFDNVSIASNSSAAYKLSTNQQVSVQAFDKFNKPVNYNLIITGLPIVKLNASQTIADADVSANFTLINPDYQAQNSQIEISSQIMISIRGAHARTYPKKAYSVHFVDATGQSSDVSLLGLRTDNGWILDAMYIDQARMRNRVCTDIWNSFNNVPYADKEPTAINGTRGYMVEVFLNDQYWGVYCLTEKVDRKQLQVKKSYGDIYKADDWSPEVEFRGLTPFINSSQLWAAWEYAYPDLGDTPSPTWQYLYDIIGFVSSSSDDDFKSQIATKVDLNNIADYFLFINAFGAFDNQSKNTFFSFYDYRNSPAFFYSLWDMDGTIGRNWDGSYLTPSALIAGNCNNNLLNRLIALNPGNFKQLLKTRWNAIKNNQLSKTTVSSRIEAYRKLLVNTNAFTRERDKWGNITQDLDTETKFMSDWYGSQFDRLDNYIGNL